MGTRANRIPLLMSEQRFRAIQAQTLIERAHQAIILLDLDGNVLECNAGAEDLHGYAQAEIQGRPYSEFIPPAALAEFSKLMQKMRRGRQVPTQVVRRLHKDGSERPVKFSIYPLQEDGGELIGFLTLSVDLSEQFSLESRLRHQASLMQSIVQTVVDGIVTIDLAGIITAVNPSVETMFGYRGHELIGCNVKILMPEPYHSEHDDYLKRYLKTGEARIIGIGREVTAVRKDGSVFPIELAVSRLDERDNTGFVGVLRDISERKAAEESRRALTEELKHKVHDLAHALQKLQRAQSQLVESEKLASLGSLVAGVAHEINTPVGVCITASSYLTGNTRAVREQYEGGELDADGLLAFLDAAEEAGMILERNLGKAAELVRSFKQVAVDRSSNLKRRFKLADFLGDLLSSLSPEIRRTRHQIKVECPPNLVLESFPGALSQVLTNLLQNALLHGFDADQAGEIRIRAQVRKFMLHLSFEDNGKGIASDHLSQVFDPFFTTRRGRGGTGLGLSVAYNLVKQALRGELTVSSTLGQGTRFVLTIPMKVQGEDN